MVPWEVVGDQVAQRYSVTDLGQDSPVLCLHPSFRAFLRSSLQHFCWCRFSLGDSWVLVLQTHLDSGCGEDSSSSSSCWLIRSSRSVRFCSLFHQVLAQFEILRFSALHQLPEFCHYEPRTSSFLVKCVDVFPQNTVQLLFRFCSGHRQGCVASLQSGSLLRPLLPFFFEAPRVSL